MSRRTWGCVAVLLGSPYLVLTGAALLAFWVADGASAGWTMAGVAALLLAPLGVILLVGARMLRTPARAPSGHAAKARSPARTVYHVTLGMLFLQAVIWFVASMVTSGSSRSRAYQAAMLSDLRNLAALQELHFQDARAYSEDLEVLAFVAVDGVLVEVRASETGWAARVSHAALGPGGNHCVRHSGDVEPIPLRGGALARRPGVIRCKERSPPDALRGLPGDGLLLYVHRSLRDLTL